MGKRKYTDAQKARAVRLREDGKSLREIARRTGINWKTLHQQFISVGAYPPGRPPRRLKGTVTRGRAITPAEDAKIRAMALAGTRVSHIARALARPVGTVRYRLQSAAAVEEAQSAERTAQ